MLTSSARCSAPERLFRTCERVAKASEALSFELAAIGVKVKMIKPGMINTSFAETVDTMFDVDPTQTEYAPFVETVMAGMQQAGSQPSEPVVVAEAIWRAATDGSDQLRYIAGADAEQIIAARKAMDDPEYLAMVRNSMGL